MNGHLGRFINRLQPSPRAGLHQVARNLGLAIGGDEFATGQSVHINRVALAGKNQFDAVVWNAMGCHTCTHTRFMKHVNRGLLQYAGPDAAQDIVAALALDDDVGNTRFMQQLAKKQARRACTDDHNLGSHGSSWIRSMMRGSTRMKRVCRKKTA